MQILMAKRETVRCDDDRVGCSSKRARIMRLIIVSLISVLARYLAIRDQDREALIHSWQVVGCEILGMTIAGRDREATTEGYQELDASSVCLCRCIRSVNLSKHGEAP